MLFGYEFVSREKSNKKSRETLANSKKIPSCIVREKQTVVIESIRKKRHKKTSNIER
jgi:hypothetical protein